MPLVKASGDQGCPVGVAHALAGGVCVCVGGGLYLHFHHVDGIPAAFDLL